MEMRKLDERGKQCPMPVIEAKQALAEAAPGEMIEVIVDNEIAVQNLTKMAKHKQLKSAAEKKGEREFSVVIEAGAKEQISAISTPAHRHFWNGSESNMKQIAVSPSS